MTPSLTRRQLARRLKRAEWLVDGLSLAALTGYILYQYSWLVLNPEPATGGDTGSHFWALWSLVHHGISSGTLRPWSPGNMGGEPILLHYFPFSFLLMWVLALFVPIGMAFNLGTNVVGGLLPHLDVRLSAGNGESLSHSHSRRRSRDAGAFQRVLLDVGGNLLSTLAGQFAHGYAIDFFLLGAGALGWELRTGRVPLLSPFLFSAVFLSHAYVFLALPVLVLASALFLSGASLTQRLRSSAVALTVGILLAFWFLVPLLANSEWTTAFASQWSFADTLKETFGRVLIPLPILIAASLGCLAFLRGPALRSGILKSQFVLWLVVLLFFVALYLASKPLGIINARSVPQMLVIAAIVTAMLMGHVVRHLGGRCVALCHVAPLILITLY
jgi:hypothetical protein